MNGNLVKKFIQTKGVENIKKINLSWKGLWSWTNLILGGNYRERKDVINSFNVNQLYHIGEIDASQSSRVQKTYAKFKKWNLLLFINFVRSFTVNI